MAMAMQIPETAMGVPHPAMETVYRSRRRSPERRVAARKKVVAIEGRP
jgi:hypothetical protein